MSKCVKRMDRLNHISQRLTTNLFSRGDFNFMIAIGSDHGGYELKEAIMSYFDSENIEYKDFGIHKLEAVDYSDVGVVVANAVTSGECD